MTNKNKINWSVRPKKWGMPKIKKKRGSNKKGGIANIKNVYKKPKSNTKYINHFLHLTKTQNQKKV